MDLALSLEQYRHFIDWMREEGMPVDRLSNDKRFTSMETEWAFRGYAKAVTSGSVNPVSESTG
jgi:hypothetical protein